MPRFINSFFCKKLLVSLTLKSHLCQSLTQRGWGSVALGGRSAPSSRSSTPLSREPQHPAVDLGFLGGQGVSVLGGARVRDPGSRGGARKNEKEDEDGRGKHFISSHVCPFLFLLSSNFTLCLPLTREHAGITVKRDSTREVACGSRIFVLLCLSAMRVHSTGKGVRSAHFSGDFRVVFLRTVAG